MKNFDFIVAGAGITGLALAWKIKNKFPEKSLLIIDKEKNLGAHSSGRNSGVLHSGIYYKEDSLKAKFCASGSRQMKDFCLEYKLPINEIGKVIVPTKPEDDHIVDLLYKRAQLNGASKVSIISADEMKTVEPMAKSASERALYSPQTAVVSPKMILEKLTELLKQKKVEFLLGKKIRGISPGTKSVICEDESFQYGLFCNCAGSYADKLAKPFGIADQYTMLPFKGIYYKLDTASGIKLNGLVYPVPDMNVPFLGVHSVKSIDGTDYFGPTAIPAFGRENYHGIKGIKLNEFGETIYHTVRQYSANKQGFRNYAHAEAGRFLKSKFAEACRVLIPALQTKYLKSCDKVGIRGQLLDKVKKEMVMDFLVEKAENSIHVLNVVSPGFTSAFSFSEYILQLSEN